MRGLRFTDGADRRVEQLIDVSSIRFEMNSPSTPSPRANPPVHSTGESRSNRRDEIYHRLRSAIVGGQMRPGDRLPSVRSLAVELGASRGTVLAALQRLAGEGLVASARSAGTRVVYGGHPPVRDAPAAVHAIAPASPPSLPQALQPGLPAFDVFPKKLWSRLVGQEARRMNAQTMAYPDPTGEPQLKRAIAAYLQVSRGVTCDAEQIVVTNCYQGNLQFVRQLILAECDTAWVEDPGYRLTHRLLQKASVPLIPVRVDSEGLDVRAGIDAAPHARAAFVSPTHQFPMGVRLSERRREELLSWAGAHRAWIVEDDYDGEYHYTPKTEPALKSFDREDRVIYCGTMSKVLFPALRVAYLVLPRDLVGRATALAEALHPAPAPLLQQVVAAFIHDGHFSRHLARTRRVYAQRSAYLLDALGDNFPGNPKSAASCGMHMILRLADQDRLIASQARFYGMAPMALSTMFLDVEPIHGLVLGFANVLSSDHAYGLIERLATLVRRSSVRPDDGAPWHAFAASRS